MHKLKVLFILFFVLSFISCQDTITSSDANKGSQPQVIQPPVSNDPDDNITSIQFSGIDKVTNIKHTSFTVHWNAIDGVGSYQVFFKEGNKLKLIQAVNHPLTKINLRNLKPNTQYEVFVRIMDQQGRIDTNKKSVTVKTNTQADFINNSSLFFNGSSGVTLGKAKDMLSSKAITLSLWFNGLLKQQTSNLMSFHKDLSQDISLGIATEEEYIVIKYIDQLGQKQTLKTQYNYADSKWHHIAVTFNQQWYVLYIDGKRVKSMKGSQVGFGNRLATVGFSEIFNGFTGFIDEVSIWSTALGLEDIKQIYAFGKAQNLVDHRRANGLVSWYRLGDHQDDSDLVINDIFNQFNGTPQNIEMSDFSSEAP